MNAALVVGTTIPLHVLLTEVLSTVPNRDPDLLHSWLTPYANDVDWIEAWVEEFDAEKEFLFGLQLAHASWLSGFVKVDSIAAKRLVHPVNGIHAVRNQWLYDLALENESMGPQKARSVYAFLNELRKRKFDLYFMGGGS